MRRLSSIDYGLMTLEEYLAHRNPEGKIHESGSYTFSVDSMNKDYSIRPYRAHGDYSVKGRDDLSALVYCKGGKVMGVYARGTLFYTYEREKKAILLTWVTKLNDSFYLGEMSPKFKKVKYPNEYLALVSDIVKDNAKKYPHVIERFENRGEQFTVRSEAPLKGKNEGVTIGIFNEAGYKVATAQDEWGATLIGVAKEYRSRGLSKIVSRYWYKFNPNKLSGGFTPEGQRMAISFWADTVRGLLESGEYDAKIERGELTEARLRDILKGLPTKVKRVAPPKKEEVRATGEYLLWADNSSSFVLYDLAYLKEQDDKFILGYGLLRDSSDVGSFYFQLDYERSHSDLVTKIALQYAKDLGDAPLYDGKGDHYSDLLEVEGISGVEKRGDYIHIERDIIDLRPLKLLEKKIRAKVDPYGEIEYQLQEDAVSKWS